MRAYFIVVVVLIQLLSFSPIAFSKPSNEKPNTVDKIEKILAYTEAQVGRVEGMRKSFEDASVDSTPELKADTCKILNSMLPAGSIQQLKQAGIYLNEHGAEMTEVQKTRFDILKPKLDALSIDKPICG